MSALQDGARRRAERLVRWYPRAWRDRYGQEFVELLVDDIRDRPQTIRRDLDVLASAFVARGRDAGLAGPPIASLRAAQASLVGFGLCLSAFLILSLTMWAQLSVGWQWEAPRSSGAMVAMIVITICVVGFAGLAAGAAVSSASSVGRSIVSGASSLIVPGTLIICGATTLCIGAAGSEARWPGTGGHGWAAHALVPHTVAAWNWALTMWVSSYWAHPAELSRFPRAQVLWMAEAPVALLFTIAGIMLFARRIELSRPALSGQAFFSRVALGMMVLTLTASTVWVLSSSPGPHGLYRSGTIDVAGLAVMTVCLVMATKASRRARTCVGMAALL